MEKTNFHIQKENHVKKISLIVALVAMNSFSNEVKGEVAHNAKNAVDAIAEIRKEVYKKMEDFDYEFNTDLLENYVKTLNINIGELKAITSEIQTIIDEITNELSAEPTRIDDHAGFKPVMKSNEIRANDTIVVEALKNISEILGIEVKEETQLPPTATDGPSDEKKSDDIPPILPPENEVTEVVKTENDASSNKPETEDKPKIDAIVPPTPPEPTDKDKSKKKK